MGNDQDTDVEDIGIAEAYERYDTVERPHDGEWIYQNVSLDRDGSVLTITMERSDADNRIDGDMAMDLKTATKDAYRDDDIRCVVLRGTGDAFCTGIDVDHLEGDEYDGQVYRVLANRVHSTISYLVGMDKPVVAAVEGVAANGGVGLTLAADLVLVDTDATFECTYHEIGLTGDCGITYFLPRYLGTGRARQVLLGRRTIDADDALEHGIAVDAVPAERFDERLETLVSDVVDGPTKSFGKMKDLLTDGPHAGLVEHLKAEESAVVSVAKTEDFRRGVRAYRENDTPSFEGT